MSAPTIDEAIRAIGPEGMARLARDHMIEAGGGALWAGRYSHYAETAARLARERETLFCRGFLQQAGFDEMRSAISDPLLTGRTRRLAEAFVTTLPGYRPDLRRQRATTMDQHGYHHMVLVRMIHDLQDAGEAIVPHVLAGTVDREALDQARRIGLA